jgi:hypothetical protein
MFVKFGWFARFGWFGLIWFDLVWLVRFGLCNAKASSLKYLEVYNGLEVMTTNLCVIYKEL